MGHSSDELTNLRESEVDDYADKVYQQLKKGEFRVKASTNYFKCPFCAPNRNQEYSYNDLLHHARGLGKSSRSDNLRQKGNHLALKDYLQKYHIARSASKPSKMSEPQEKREPRVGCDRNEKMGHSSHELTDLSELEVEEYADRVYKQLQKGEFRVKASTNYFKCPFCAAKGNQEYSCNDLLQHARGLGESSRSDNLKQKGSHLALKDYLQKYHSPRSASKPPERSEPQEKRVSHEKSESHVGCDRNEKMGHSSHGLTDLSELEVEDYADKVYKQLKKGEFRVKASTNYFKCPFCAAKRNQEYSYNDILQHARGLGKSSRSDDLMQKGNHLALEDYLQKYHSPRSSWKPPERSEPQEKRESHEKSESRVGCDRNEKFVWPWVGIIANIPVEKKGGRYVGDSGSKMKEELAGKGFNPLKVIPLWSHQGHSGYAVVKFNRDFLGFGNAMSFERAFASDSHGKLDWYRRTCMGDKLYGWVAREDDYMSSSIVGKYLRDNGDLKSIADVELEEARKTKCLVSNLMKTIEDKKIQSKEIESKIKQTSDSLQKLLDERDAMAQKFSDEIQMMQQTTWEDTKNILVDHEKFKMILESQKEKLKQQEKELEKREADYDSKIIKLRRLRKMTDSASLEQQKADENVRALVEKHKVEKEELHKKVIDLQKQIDQKQALELQIEQLRGAAHVMEHMERDVETKKRMDAIQEELKEKEEELEDLEQLTQALIVKERKCNDELQEARKELINGLKTSKSVRATVGVRNMGVLDEKPFKNAAKAKYLAEEAPKKAEEMITQCEQYIEDPDWHPFKVVRENGTDKAVINEEDERLKSIRNEMGDEVCQAVTKVLCELNEYNPSGRYPVPELWNFKAERKASLKEGAEYILNLWRVNKRRRRT